MKNRVLWRGLIWAALVWGQTFLAGAEVGRLEIICEPGAMIFIDNSIANPKISNKINIVVDVGTRRISAQADGYELGEATAEVYPKRTTKVALYLVKSGQDRNSMANIPAGDSGIGLNKDKISWICKNIGGCEKDYQDSVPQHTVKLKSYAIDKYEVTNSQYKKFITATKRAAPKHWQEGNYPREQDDYPVVNVTWEDAQAYCRWAGKGLPPEEEWERAARGSKDFFFPWGPKFREGRANTAELGFKGPTITGRFEAGASPYGCMDMSGNVAEWTASPFEPYPGSISAKADGSLRVVRGGSFKSPEFMATTIYRLKLPGDKGYPDVGFRCSR